MQCGGARSSVATVHIGEATRDGGSPDEVALPTPAPLLRDVAQLSVGMGHVCAVTKSHTVVCWGDNAAGQLGTGLDGRSVGTTLLRPHVVGGLPPIASVVAGKMHTCAIDVRGEVWCWGSAGGDLVVTAGGAVGSVELRASELGRPVRIPLGDGVAHLVALSHTTTMACAAYPNDVRCWDTFQSIPLNAHTVSPPHARTKQLAGVTAMSLAHGDVCAVISSSGLFCWRDAVAPAAVTWPPGDAFVPAKVALGEQHGCVASRAGEVRCWSSFMGDFWAHAPSLVVTWSGKSPTRALDVGDSPICTADSHGHVDCFLSAEGGLTDDAVERSWASTELGPHPIAGLSQVVDIGLGLGRDIMGYGFGCALLTTSNVACWGDNDSGQLGTGKEAPSKTAVFVVSP